MTTCTHGPKAERPGQFDLDSTGHCSVAAAAPSRQCLRTLHCCHRPGCSVLAGLHHPGALPLHCKHNSAMLMTAVDMLLCISRALLAGLSCWPVLASMQAQIALLPSQTSVVQLQSCCIAGGPTSGSNADFISGASITACSVRSWPTSVGCMHQWAATPLLQSINITHNSDVWECSVDAQAPILDQLLIT